MECIEKYKLWCDKVTDNELSVELEAMSGDESLVEDAFYRDLEFGTAGLRGVIGAGTNRMNVYTVAKATQGLANYLKSELFGQPSVAIGYDSRIKSDLFSQITASVLAANGIKVYLWPQLMPVPALSYTVRALGTSAGVVVTASHNPSKYNGYKVYGNDGCQITSEAANAILGEIEKLDIFEDVASGDFDGFVESGMIEYIDESVYNDFIENVKAESVLFGEEVDKNIAIIYSPLNGAGLGPVTRVLRESGYGNITVVKEQEQPDGNFPTCPYPNPEIREAMELGIEYAQRGDADLLLATDPDCDRVGIAVKDGNGEFVLLTGNQTGILLFDYICSQRVKNEWMPKDALFVKSIVTSDLCEKIAAKYGVTCKNVLTGFKYIGEQIGELEAYGNEASYIFGFEESYGYLSGTYVRDKDAVNGAFLICEMFCYYASQGISLIDKLNQIYEEFGYCLNSVHSYAFEGAVGFDKMQEIMKNWRSMVSNLDSVVLGGLKAVGVLDYDKGVDGLPKANVIKFLLEGDCSVIIRPSGTEPKIKAYLSIIAGDKSESESLAEKILLDVEKLMK